MRTFVDAADRIAWEREALPITTSGPLLLTLPAEVRDKTLLKLPRIKIAVGEELSAADEGIVSLKAFLQFAPEAKPLIPPYHDSDAVVILSFPFGLVSIGTVDHLFHWLLFSIFRPHRYQKDEWSIHEDNFSVPRALDLMRVFEALRMMQEAGKLARSIDSWLGAHMLPSRQINQVLGLERREQSSVWIQKIADTILEHQFEWNSKFWWHREVRELLNMPENGVLREMVKARLPDQWEMAARRREERMKTRRGQYGRLL